MLTADKRLLELQKLSVNEQKADACGAQTMLLNFSHTTSDVFRGYMGK